MENQRIMTVYRYKSQRTLMLGKITISAGKTAKSTLESLGDFNQVCVSRGGGSYRVLYPI